MNIYFPGEQSYGILKSSYRKHHSIGLIFSRVLSISLELCVVRLFLRADVLFPSLRRTPTIAIDIFKDGYPRIAKLPHGRSGEKGRRKTNCRGTSGEKGFDRDSG